MDILYEISQLLYEDSSNLEGRSPDYVALCQIEAGHFERIAETLGQEEADKLIEVQEERSQIDKLRCFLFGLRLGVALLDQPFAGYQSTWGRASSARWAMSAFFSRLPLIRSGQEGIIPKFTFMGWKSVTLSSEI